jgi:predicted ester cyclase
MSPSATAVVERFIDDVLNGGRPESAPVLVASEPLCKRIGVLRAAFEDLHVRVIRLIAEGPLVAVHLAGTGTHTGPFQGSAPTGRAWATSCTAIYEVADGRIVDFWLTWDMLDIAEQLGVVRRAD